MLLAFGLSTRPAISRVVTWRPMNMKDFSSIRSKPFVGVMEQCTILNDHRDTCKGVHHPALALHERNAIGSSISTNGSVRKRGMRSTSPARSRWSRPIITTRCILLFNGIKVSGYYRTIPENSDSKFGSMDGPYEMARSREGGIGPTELILTGIPSKQGPAKHHGRCR